MVEKWKNIFLVEVGIFDITPKLNKWYLLKGELQGGIWNYINELLVVCN